MNLALIALIILWWIFVIPYYNHFNYHFVLYVGLAIYFTCLYNYNRCFFIDPGIIPRGHRMYQEGIYDAKIKIEDKDNNNLK